MIAVLAFAPAGAVGAEEPAFDEATVDASVQRTFGALVAAARSLDVDDYLSFFDREHFTALNADGSVVHSFAAFEDAIRNEFALLARYESLAFDRVKVTALDADTAILVNEFRAVVVLTSGETVSAAGGGTQVWRKTGGAWKLVSVSSSARPAE